MGLFDKIKSMANAVTGGAAKVSLEVIDARLTAPFEVVVRAQSQGVEVKYSRVYLQIEGVEEVALPEPEDQPDMPKPADGEKHKHESTSARTLLLDLELPVAGSGVIAENATAEWRVKVELPKNAAPVYAGKNAKHYYRILAGLDCVGNDPDSGWVRLTIL